MHPVLKWLVPLVMLLAAISAATGLLAEGGQGPYTFTTIHGQSVQMYGRGLYQNDSLLVGAALRGTDAVTLFISLPLLLICYLRARRASRNALIGMLGALFYFLYNGASLAFSASFNALFLVYTALFSASFFAVVISLSTFDARGLVNRVKPRFPQRASGLFLIAAGSGTLLLWTSELIGPLLAGSAPEIIGPYTTLFTHAFDSAIIAPAAIMSGAFLLRRKPLGYLLAAPFLILISLIGLVVIAQTISQALAGLFFPVGIYVGMIGSWVVLGGCAVALVTIFFRHLAP